MIPQWAAQQIKKSDWLASIARRTLSRLPVRWRLGKDFWSWYQFFQEAESWSREKSEAWQVERLNELLKTLSRFNPYYSNLLKESPHLPIKNLRNFTAAIPTMDRETYRANGEKLICEKLLKNSAFERATTSGTTGQAHQFFHPLSDYSRELAAIYHLWRNVDFNPETSIRAEFRGLTRPGSLVDAFPDQRMIRASVIDLRSETLPKIADRIREAGVTHFHGYPGSIYSVARLIKAHGISFPSPVGIMFASEMVYDFQVDAIQEVFPNSKIYAHYGCAERTVLGGWCKGSRHYHLIPTYSVTEFDPQSSEIVATNLFNTLTPFLRYRMKDVASKVSTEPCPACGLTYTRITELGGRSGDLLFSPEKGWIAAGIVTYPFKKLKWMQEVQIHQQVRDTLKIIYSLVGPNISEDLLSIEIEFVRKEMHRLFGNQMKMQFERVGQFEKGATGKFKWIVNEMEEKSP